jgi:DNA primase
MSIILDTIIKANKITDYLSSKGVQWSSFDGGRYKYRCPLPSHKSDKTPSFFVYDKPTRQDYYCYGCKSAGSIIQFIASYEQISIKETIQRLSAGLNINIDDVLESVIREILLHINDPGKEDKGEDLLASSLFISVHMHDFLRKVNFDPNEIQIAEKVFALADSLVLIENLEELEKLSDALPKRTGYRYQMFLEKQKQEEIQSAKDFRSYE